MNIWTLKTGLGDGSNPLTNGHPNSDIYGGTFVYVGTLLGQKVYSICSLFQPQPDRSGAVWELGNPSSVATGYVSSGNTIITCQNYPFATSLYPIDVPNSPPSSTSGKTDIEVAVTDEVSSLTLGVKLKFAVRRDFTLSTVFAGVSSPSSIYPIVIDVKKNGDSIFDSNHLVIDAVSDTSLTSETVVNIIDNDFLQGDVITVEILGVDADAKGLKLYFLST